LVGAESCNLHDGDFRYGDRYLRFGELSMGDAVPGVRDFRRSHPPRLGGTTGLRGNRPRFCNGWLERLFFGLNGNLEGWCGSGAFDGKSDFGLFHNSFKILQPVKNQARTPRKPSPWNQPY
jgi:hypothetical protein